MEKIHCECCDEVIPSSEKRVLLKPGGGKGNSFDEEDEFRDYCLRCARLAGEKILRDILDDWKEELNA